MTQKTAVVTGSAQGIGKAIAERLASDGFKVVVSDIDEEKLQEAYEELKDKGYEVAAKVADTAKNQDHVDLVDYAVDTFGSVDVYVNNAGIGGKLGQLIDTSEDYLDQIISINVKGVFFGIKAAAKQMIKQGKGGRIINASSVAGEEGQELLGVYSVTKFAVRGLTQVASKELAEHQITVNSYNPGFVGTGLLDQAVEAFKASSDEKLSDQEIIDSYIDLIGLGRLGEPKDIANVVSFIASEDSAYMTGQSFIADGGVRYP